MDRRCCGGWGRDPWLNSRGSASRCSPTVPTSADILELADDPGIAGFTTNPTMMRRAGVEDYEGFARKVLDHVTDRPVSFEVFSDDFDRDETPGAPHRLMGSQRLGEDPRHQYPWRQLRPAHNRAHSRGLPPQCHRHPLPGAGTHRGRVPRRPARERRCRSSRAGSPTPAETLSRSWPPRSSSWHRFRPSNCCGPVPARSSTSARPSRRLSHHHLDPDLLAKLRGLGRNLEDVSLDTVRDVPRRRRRRGVPVVNVLNVARRRS